MLFLFPWVPTQIPSFSIGGVLTTQILWEMEQKDEEKPGNTGGKRGRRCTKMRKKAKRILALLNDPKHRSRLLESLNKDTAPKGMPVSGGNQEMTILKEMNAFEDEHDKFMDSLKGAQVD